LGRFGVLGRSEKQVRTLGRAFDLLPPLERARRYREMAEAAYLLAADASSSERKAGYLEYASAWHDLAAALERELGGISPADTEHVIASKPH
jgi:hypothetical protein